MRTLCFLTVLLLPAACGPDAGTPDDVPAGDTTALEAPEPVLISEISIFDLDTRTARTVLEARAHYEAPNWTPDGAALIFNGGGRLYRMPVEGGTPEPIDTSPVGQMTNDHGILPGGERLIFTAGEERGIYTVGIEGGAPVRIPTPDTSYWHGVSPDGQEIAYVGIRNGRTDLFTMPITGGVDETPLAPHPAADDGPDYAPDGSVIYFNSNRAGTWDIWRVPAGGGEPVQMTSDSYDDWFPHPSPDGRYLVFVSYPPGTEGHPPNRNVRLRLMPAEGGEPEELIAFLGGQGTINVPSWSPDSRAFAFVRYRLEEPGDAAE